MSKFTAIVLSGGNGKRMQTDIPKQYLEVKGKPLLYYSLKAFEESPVDDVILVAASEYIEYCCSDIVEKYGLQKVRAVVPGGTERYFSVYEGLKRVKDAKYVLIHDGARPCITPDVIRRCINSVIEEQACVAGMPVKDTIKIADKDGYADYTPNRNLVWQIQTPQCFSYQLICDAYEQLMQRLSSKEAVLAITDDAMVLEYICGKKVKLVEGDYRNIKITTPEDLVLAEQFLK